MVVGGGTVKFHFEISFTGFTLLGTTFIRHKPTPVIRPPFKKAKDSREYFLKLVNLKKTFSTSFYGWSTTVSRLQIHYHQIVYFLPPNSKEFLVLISSTLEGYKVESTLQQPSSFGRSPWIGNAVL